jgi:hypothetical protein
MSLLSKERSAKTKGGFEMKQKNWLICFATLCLLSFFFISSPAAGKPDVTRHDVNFLDNAVNMHIEWQSPNPVTSVKISMPGVEKEINVDPYDNKRNRDGYAGEVDVNLTMAGVSGQSFTYIIQLQDELRIKSLLVTGKVNISSSQQTTVVPQPQQPVMQIQIQQNLSPPQNQTGSVIIMIDPLMVTVSGAMWRVENGPWMKSGETVSNLSMGIQTIEFQDVGNWIKPENLKVMIEGGQTITITGIYNNK